MSKDSIKRFFIIASISLVAILGGWWVLRWLSFGTLIVATSDQSATVTIAYGLDDEEPKKVGKGDTTIRVTPGEYTVEVTSGEKTTRGATAVTRGQESSLNLPLTNISSATKIADYTAMDLYSNGQSIGFLNTPQKLIYTLGPGQNIASRVSETYPVANIVHWYDGSSLLFQLNDGTYYLRRNGTDQLVSISGNSEIPQLDAIDINSKGEVAYIYQDDLYYRSNILSSPILLLKGLGTQTNIPHVALSDQGVALVSFSPDSSDGEGEKNTTISNSFTINVSNKRKTEIDKQLGDAHWSPDGKRFIATTPRGLELFSKGGTSIGLLSALGDSTAQASAWVDNSRVVYVDKSTIWTYNILSSISTKLVPINGSINTTSPFAVYKNTITYETDPAPKPGSVGTIYQVNLK